MLTECVDVSGELIRSNLTENEKGVKLTLDIFAVDQKTCKPVAGEFVEIWGANATVSEGN